MPGWNRRIKRTDTVFEPRADQFDIDACGVKTLGGPDFFVFFAMRSHTHRIRKLTQMIEQGVNEVPIWTFLAQDLRFNQSCKKQPEVCERYSYLTYVIYTTPRQKKSIDF